MHALKSSMLVGVLVGSLSFAAEPVKLFPGLKLEVALGDVASVTSSDPAVADAQPSKTGVTVSAKKGGHAVLKVTKRGAAQPETLDVSVETAGWDLVPVLVAARDVAVGAVLTKADVAEGSLPRALVSSSVVKLEAAHYALGAQTHVPYRAGELILWCGLEASK